MSRYDMQRRSNHHTASFVVYESCSGHSLQSIFLTGVIGPVLAFIFLNDNLADRELVGTKIEIKSGLLIR